MIREALRTVIIAIVTGVLCGAGFLYVVTHSRFAERGWCSPGPFQTQCE